MLPKMFPSTVIGLHLEAYFDEVIFSVRGGVADIESHFRLSTGDGTI